MAISKYCNYFVYQRNQNVRKKWLPDIVLEEIKINLEDLYYGVEHSESKREWFLGFGGDGKDVFVKDCYLLLQYIGKQSKTRNLKSKQNLSDEGNDFLEKLSEIMTRNSRIKVLPFLNIEKKRLNKLIKKVDQLLGKSSVSDISETNDFIYAGISNHGEQGGTLVMVE